MKNQIKLRAPLPVSPVAHDDILHDVGEAAPSLDDSVVQNRKILLQEDDLRSVLGHIDAIHN